MGVRAHLLNWFHLFAVRPLVASGPDVAGVTYYSQIANYSQALGEFPHHYSTLVLTEVVWRQYIQGKNVFSQAHSVRLATHTQLDLVRGMNRIPCRT